MVRRTMLARTIATLGAILILAAGCSDQSPTETSLRPQVAVLSKAHQAVAVTGVVGPEGGRVDFGLGSLVFPAGAVAADTRVSAEVDGLTMAVTFGPHGLVFPAGAQPVLEFDVQGVEIPANASIFYLGEYGEALERLEIAFDADRGSALTRIGHFSQYAVAVD